MNCNQTEDHIKMEVDDSERRPEATSSAGVASENAPSAVCNDDSRLENDVSVALAALTKARLKSQRDFSHETCPYFCLSEAVKRALEWDEQSLTDFLTRPTQHRHAFQGRLLNEGIEYDLLHLKCGTVDDMYLRSVVHHDIARAFCKLNVAEMKIKEHGYSITYAIADAQLILLVDHLRTPDYSMTAYYNPKDYKGHKQIGYDNPYFVRTITDEVIVEAWESLTSNCFIFGVRKDGKECKEVKSEPKVDQYDDCESTQRSGEAFFASAFFDDLVVKEAFKFGVEMRYDKLSREHDFGQLNTEELSRD